MRLSPVLGGIPLAVLLLGATPAPIAAQTAPEQPQRMDPSLAPGGVPVVPAVPTGPTVGGPGTITGVAPGAGTMSQPIAPGVPAVPRSDPGMAIPAVPAAPMAPPLNTL